MGRASAALALTALLAACSGTSSSPVVPGDGLLPVTSADAGGSVCQTPKGFVFQGRCKTISLKPRKGVSVKFAPYKGLTLSEYFNWASSAQGSDLVVGIGTDIGGKESGYSVPTYGPKAHCFENSGDSVKCRGTVLLYNLFFNVGSVPLDFEGGGPKVIDSRAFPGKTCQEASPFFDSTREQWVWRYSTAVTAHKGEVVFPSFGFRFTEKPGQMDILAVVCY